MTTSSGSPLLRPNEAPAKKNVFPSASYGHLVTRASDQEKKNAEGAPKKTKRPQDLGEALVTRCPYEAVGENCFGRGLIRPQERTVGCLLWRQGTSVLPPRKCGRGQPLSFTLSFGEIPWFDEEGEIRRCDWSEIAFLCMCLV